MSNRDASAPVAALETLTIGISGMTCDHCARRVEKALRAQSGVKDVSVNLKAGSATVTFDRASTPVESLRQAVTRSGFKTTA